MAFDSSIIRPNLSEPRLDEPVTLTSAATVATDASAGNLFRLSIAVSRTLGVPTNPVDGMLRAWEVTNSDDDTAVTLTLASGAGGFAGVLGVTTVTTELSDVNTSVSTFTLAATKSIPFGDTFVHVAYYSAGLARWLPIASYIRDN